MEFEVRVMNLAGRWSSWMSASDHASVEKLFGNNIHLAVVSYTYNDGSIIEYRRKL